ncbi:putative esterase and lipase [Echria macrotheca]|uniref:Esterase and lipase n=1 Tax=Echria macrotheca TaxID=438768 RepID=A0AAJ0BGY9_9PEZI|nr:putative esterase and lipase [Echria macrotheca]
MWTVILSLLAFHLSVVSSLPLGISYQNPSPLPILTLPYGSYRAATYHPASDIYIFRNIRYAAPPVGNLRWAKPAPPQPESTLQDGSYGHKCVQSAISGMNLVGPGNNFPAGAAVNQFLGGIPIPLFQGGDEDCLFLDVYVPAKALKNPSLKLPVVVWIYGGAYVFGSKDTLQPELPFYDGSGMMSKGDMIFVAMNYRLGAYGWLAGTTMERDGLPNAGLWDQRAALQWVRDYIHLLGGDPTKVTAMGESAGAGSILHHLVGEGGTLDPLFSKAVLQSPAFQPMWDRAGTVQATFETFAQLAGCPDKTLACLRGADGAALARANKLLGERQTPGTMAVGPTADGSLIRQLPQVELRMGNVWKGLDGAILSHTADESGLFVSGAIQTDAQFSTFLDAIFPNYTRAAGVTGKVEAFYPGLAKSNKYKTESARVSAFLRESCFTCSIRYLTTALGEPKVWSMQYSVFPGIHGSDLLPTFYSPLAADVSSLVSMLMVPALGMFVSGISAALQSYFASFITTGDPNTRRAIWNLPPAISWSHPSCPEGEQASRGVLDVGNWGFGTVSDDQNLRAPCDFWADFAAAVTILGGYVPPGVEVPPPQGFAADVSAGVDVSRNYKGGNR